ncbi:MAG: diacylglycerol kinase family lipid kinase [Gemmatimonadetes bacterium]|nr:diacylglycerol kinase family lipid kinase [Gemmatimonadota bacterium]NNM03572.1 diacylglycerol kinase family lipid kinase [Gemmatimonadota bacterium]
MNSRPKNIAVILNPEASWGAGGRIQPVVEAELDRRKIPFELFRTEAPGHAGALAQEAASRGADALLVVGGDGTIHEAVNGILATEFPAPPLAVVPVGTGNDFFRMVGAEKDPARALDVLDQGSLGNFDVGHVRFGGSESFFVNLLGLGIDVEILRKRTKFRKLRGLPQYLAGLASALTTFRPSSFRVSFRTAGRAGSVGSIEDRTILTAITVGPSVGGGFLINPEASPFDGLLDLFFVRALGIFKLSRYIPKVIRGTHGNVPELLQQTIIGADVTRTDGEPFFFEMDGEPVAEPVKRLEVTVCPGKLPVLLPGRDE